jgi:hypothetical protein
MSKHVDWEREDLFHLPFDTLLLSQAETVPEFRHQERLRLYEYDLRLPLECCNG